ncbi:MAG: hypothetical protein KDA36_13105, partial [Planctomycetaceae bacterium]|nr:hypothetical protein [Planctomycetaceae bacterium]
WISPRHPQIISNGPGTCPICGVTLVPATDLGFSDQPEIQGAALVVPRDAVLMTGATSVVYVETKPGRFELRRVLLGPTCGDLIAILDGVQEGEQVAERGNFLIDSQMQLAGNPSLIDPFKAVPETREELTPVMLAELEKLSPIDRELVSKQVRCPVTNLLLGSMGTPTKIEIEGQQVMICCPACEERLKKSPGNYLEKIRKGPAETDSPLTEEIKKNLAQLSEEDRMLADEQTVCPVAGLRLGSMGTPIRIDVQGRAVLICCESCRDRLLSHPDKYLKKSTPVNSNHPEESVPPLGEIQIPDPPADQIKSPSIEVRKDRRSGSTLRKVNRDTSSSGHSEGKTP